MRPDPRGDGDGRAIRERAAAARAVGLLVLVLALGGCAADGRGGPLPERWNPWAPLDLAAEPNGLTRLKLARLADDGAQCLATLAAAEMNFTPVDDREVAPGCGFSNAVRVESTTAAVGQPFALTCPAAVSLALWERHVLQPAAERHFGQPVARLEHWGTFACRNVYGRPAGRFSEHAHANAIDLAGFVLADGTRIRVVRDWATTPGAAADAPDAAARAAFLREVRDGACRFFEGVLGPDYNRAHADHLHFDRGPYRICR